MTKKGVAEAIGVTPNTIHRYETGAVTPPLDNIDCIAAVLRFPTAFFYGADIDEPRRDNASFRGMASKSGKLMDAALAAGAISFIFDDWITERYSLPEPDILDLKNEDPEVAAALMRQHWGLGTKPIKNMVHLLEGKGIRVYSLAESTSKVDAFSLWRNETPYVFLNSMKSAERSRFDAAHELAHLCLHAHGGASSRYIDSDLEKEADAFAGAFLMPETDVRAICNEPIYTVEQLVDYKMRWRVSCSALNYGLHKYGLIPKSKYQSNYVEMSRRGWLKNEPRGIAREQSAVWQFVIDDLRAQGISKSEIADLLSIPATEIENCLFGLANMLSIDGSGATRTPKRTVALRLVVND